MFPWRALGESPDAKSTSPQGSGEEPSGSGGQGHRVVAQHGVDLALHLLDLAIGPGLEAEGQIRVGVRGAHESPAAAWKDHPGAVGVNRLVPPLELLRDLLDDPE